MGLDSDVTISKIFKKQLLVFRVKKETLLTKVKLLELDNCMI